VAREVGTDGRLGGQAVVPGVDWHLERLTDSVNSMAGNLTGTRRTSPKSPRQWRAATCRAKIHGGREGEILELRTPSTPWWTSSNAFASEVTRFAREVGTEGKLAVRPRCPVSPEPGRT